MAVPVLRSAGYAATTGPERSARGSTLPPPLTELDGADVLGDARCCDGTMPE